MNFAYKMLVGDRMGNGQKLNYN